MISESKLLRKYNTYIISIIFLLFLWLGVIFTFILAPKIPCADNGHGCDISSLPVFIASIIGLILVFVSVIDGIRGFNLVKLVSKKIPNKKTSILKILSYIILFPPFIFGMSLFIAYIVSII